MIDIKEIKGRAIEAHSSNDPEALIYDVMSRFADLYAPTLEMDEPQEERPLRQISARLPESSIEAADRLASLLSYSRNDIMIQAMDYYIHRLESHLRNMARDFQQSYDDQRLIDAIDHQLDMFE